MPRPTRVLRLEEPARLGLDGEKGARRRRR